MTDERTISPRAYFLIFGALLSLTVTTVLAANAPLGSWHTPMALAIAAGKTTLVVLFFMHVLHSTKLTKLVIVGSLLWLSILFALLFADYLSRGWLTS